MGFLLVFGGANRNLVVVIEQALNKTIVGCAVAFVAHKERRLNGTIVGIFEDRIENALQVFGMTRGEHTVERETDHHGRVVKRHVVGNLSVGAFAQRYAAVLVVANDFFGLCRVG